MIYLKDISFGYSKNQYLFEDLDLTIQKGNIYGLLGRNGAGKTTLLRLIAGLLFPQKGVCEVMGYRPQDRQPDFLSELYFLNEDLYVPPIHIKTYEKLHGPFYPKFDVIQFYNYLEEFEIDPSQNLSKLSYGQKKKVLLSFGLATNCRLLILDEPTNGLDIPSKTQFRKIIAGSISDTRSFIISTHQVRDMTNLIDPIIILDEGKLLFNESLESISQKLFFELHSGLTEPTGVLHAERVPGGYLSVDKNTSGADSEIDLEIMFNAVVNKKSIIKQLFQKEVQHDI